MSGAQTRRRLAADFAAYLRQQLEDGNSWYFDEGPPAAGASARPALAAAAPRPAPVEKPEAAAAGSAGACAAGATAAGTSAAPAAPAAESAFEAACAAFVADALRRLGQRRPQAVQTDIFAAQTAQAGPRSREEKAAALAALAAEVAPCARCKLAAGRTQTVFGVGDPDADLVLIGEAPGRDEDLQGQPFVGRAGQLLNDILKAIGLARGEVYICNILKCRPPDNRDPERDEVEACEPYLKRQLEIIAPRVICCLGRHAAHTLLGTAASLAALRESVHFYAGVPVLVTFHPAALLRNPHWKRPTWDDVRRLRALYDALRAG